MKTEARAQESSENFPHAAPETEAEAPRARRASQKPIRVPNKLLGLIFAAEPEKNVSEKKSSSIEAAFSQAHATRAAYIKMLGEGWNEKKKKPRNFAANSSTYKNIFGIGEFSFRQARMAESRAVGGYGRHQSCPHEYATEDVLPSIEDGYVEMPEWAVRDLDHKTFAFAVRVRLSPDPLTPQEAAKDIGVVNPKTYRKLAHAAAATKPTKLIALHRGPRGTLLVGRPGADFSQAVADLGKNHQGKNHRGKNHRAHCTWKPGTKAGSKAPFTSSDEEVEAEQNKSHDTRSAAERAADAKVFEKKPWQARLSPWRSHPDIEKRCGPDWDDGEYYCANGEPPSAEEKAEASRSLWERQVTVLGDVPPRLLTADAYAQAVDLAREVVHRLQHSATYVTLQPDSCSLSEALVAVARYVAAGWHRDPKDPMVSFAHIALRLFRELESGSRSVIDDLPSYMAQRQAIAARDNAEKLVSYAASRAVGHRLDADRLSSTLEFEALHERLLRFGNGDLQRGWQVMHVAIDNTARCSEGYHYPRWEFFYAAAEAEYQRDQKRRRAAERRARERNRPSY